MPVDIQVVQTLLRVNGLSTKSNSQEVTSVLLQAGYSKADIEEAIMTLQIQPYQPPPLNDLLYTPIQVPEDQLATALVTTLQRRWNSTKLILFSFLKKVGFGPKQK